MARAMVRKTNILLLDEATASVDGDYDANIQEVLRREVRKYSCVKTPFLVSKYHCCNNRTSTEYH